MKKFTHYQFIVPHTVQNSESYSAFYFAEKYDIVWVKEGILSKILQKERNRHV